MHLEDVRNYDYINYVVRRDYLSSGRTRSMSTSPCTATTRLRLHVLYLNLVVRCDYSALAAQALRQPRRAPRVLVSWPQRPYIDYTVRRRDIIFWAYDYLDYLPRLVSTRKLVEDGSRDINN
jgi:hypothetical protein